MTDKYLIDGHKLYWHLDRVAQWQKERIVAPLYIEISPVSFCNHRCIFCGIDFAQKQDKKILLSTGTLCRRIKEMGKLGVRSIMFAGEGEPLLHPGLVRMVKAAKAAGIDVSITTNGSIGNVSLWKEMLPELSWVRFSVDAGSPEVYAGVHGVSKDAFIRTVGNIGEVLRLKKSSGLGVTVGAQFVVIRENAKDLDNALPLFSRLGLDYCIVKPYSLHPQMLRKKDVVYTRKMIDALQETVRRHEKKSRMNIIFRSKAFQKYSGKKMEFMHCYALPFWGYLSANGDFYTCSVFIGHKRFRAGNIYKRNMRQIFFGKARGDSIAFAEKELRVNRVCRLNCRMARVNEFLGFLESSPGHVNFI